jgi:hypothetical protein
MSAERDQIVRAIEDGTLLLLGWRYGIPDDPRYVAERRGSYVRLTQRGVRELERVNSVRSSR